MMIVTKYIDYEIYYFIKNIKLFATYDSWYQMFNSILIIKFIISLKILNYLLHVILGTKCSIVINCI